MDSFSCKYVMVIAKFDQTAYKKGNTRSNHLEVFLRKCTKICSKFTGEHPCQSVISIKVKSNFTEIALRHGCSPVNLLHIFRTPFLRNTSVWLLLWYWIISEITVQSSAQNGILHYFFRVTLGIDVWTFFSGQSLSKPSWFSNITKTPSAFKF